MEKEQRKNGFSEWLEHLQQESWQLELLISGLAIFGIWESRNVLMEFEDYLSVMSVQDIRLISNIFIKLLWSGWIIFIFNLILHIIIRGLWIGAIGLRYVSGEIEYEELNYSDRFTRYLKSRIGSFDNYIESLEKISSVLFSFTFLLFFMFSSLVVFNSVFFLSISFLDKLFPDNNQLYTIFGITYYVFGFIVLIDFITLGAFKKIKDPTVSAIYLWIYRIYSYLSISFLYRPLLLNFLDNSYTRKVLFMAIPYAVLLIGANGMYVNRYALFPIDGDTTDIISVPDNYVIHWNYYDDLRLHHLSKLNKSDNDRVKSKINYISLNKYEINSDLIKFFLEYRENDEDYIDRSDRYLPDFQKKGIGHTFFMNRTDSDSTLRQLIITETEEIKLARRIIKKEQIPDTISSEIISYYSKYEYKDFEKVKDQIRSKYQNLENEYRSHRLQETLQALQSLYHIALDGQNIDHAIDCQFYIHPNMHERGLLCYYQGDSLATGNHQLSMTKKNHSHDCSADCRKIERHLLFRKI